ncbi:glycosyltransferase family 2 protein [Flavobacterium amniphilum]|uniref:glycosyltransferase family A protein n=1 Tax=Flavobacterium amniphilum TaxID=1834035 RepID=UPI00202A93A8|nr:glycosyltransferase family A protein [Flavobacterium amniphilum]MCL9805106.1 glycosyltransferase family 2 protein [Flavobacterium amniphilum]
MRIGFNPNKDKELPSSEYFHQVIIPVYIPNQEGYFKDSLQVLKYCLESLFKTSHSKTYFTVVNNGSCTVVSEYLDGLYRQGRLQELIHTTGIGKLNAILKGLTGHQFELITITDADVLFQNDWQNATYEVFEAFPEAGVVSPSPNPKMLRYYTANVIAKTLFSGKVSFSKVEDKEALKSFAQSIGNDKLYKGIHLNKNLTIFKNGIRALIGAGHFVATYNGVCFENLKQRYSKFSLGGDSEELILDKPATDLGLWRLSTSKNYAFHMGNVSEEWMNEKLKNLNNGKTFLTGVKTGKANKPKIWSLLFLIVFSKIIFRKPVWKLYLKIKGLSKEEASQY